MKVLFTTNIPSPYRIDFFNELSRYCDLTVLCERNYANDRNDEWLKSKEIKFNMKYLKGIKVGNETAFCPEIVKYLKKAKYDIIIVGGYSTPTGMLAIQYLKLHKMNFILNCDGGIIKNDSKMKYKIKKYFISSAKGWLSTGKETTKYLEYYGANKKFIYNYPFSSIKEEDILDVFEIEKEKKFFKQELEIGEERSIVTVGQFIHRKGFDVLIKASQYIPKEIGIYIIGGEATEEYIELKEKMQAKNVHFIDFKQKEELAKYYKASDLFVLPTREDIWGLVINEAMAHGLPVITTDKCVAGLELIEDGKNGDIVPVDQERELAEKIVNILNNKFDMTIMSKNNITKIRQYTIEEMAKRHKEIFNEILKKEI